MNLLISTGPGLVPSPEGHLIVLDWAGKRIIDSFCYRHQVHDQIRKGLEGASWHQDRLLVASECELLDLEVAPLRLTMARTFPYLNDVHHVVASDEQIWVCNSGLDRIDEFNSEWGFERSHDLLGPPARRLRYAVNAFRRDSKNWYSRFRGWDKAYDHLNHRPRFKTARKLLIKNAFGHNGQDLRFSLFRPHIVHPNHLFRLEDDVLVTLFATGEVISLKTGRILVNGLGNPHDGVVADGELYTTDCATNRLFVHAFDAAGPTVGQLIKETVITESLMQGFLRGVVVEGDVVYVGLTARRRAPEVYSRACIVALDRKTHQPLDEWVLPHEYGKNIFTILDATERYN